MDIAAARAALPGIVRGAFGERVTLRPMRAGKMKQGPDETRAVLLDVLARVDVWPDLVQLGGGREKPTVTMAQGEQATASIERAAITWPDGVEQGDLLARDPGKGGGLYRITRTGEGGEGRILLYLSVAAS